MSETTNKPENKVTTARMRVISVTNHAGGTQQVNMQAENIEDGDNKDWATLTDAGIKPAGACTLHIMSGSPAINSLEPNKAYWITISEQKVINEIAAIEHPIDNGVSAE